MVIEISSNASYEGDDKDIFLPDILQPEVKFHNLQELKGTRNRFVSPASSDFESYSNSTDNKKKSASRIPDGGYGWVIVLSSLVISLIADGISFSFGLIYIELLVYFNESKSKTAWIGSLFLSVPLLVGPIMSNLVDKYGCRKMTIIGGIISSAGFALSSICGSVEMLYLTFGISGIGLGMGYVTAVVSIAFWFDKRRTFATGIGASGTGIGTFLYAPFTQWLIDYYGWKGATLILAGTMLHACVFGALMRDPDWLIEEHKLESRSQSVTTFSSSSVCLDEIKKMLETGANKEALLDTLVTNVNTEANQQVLLITKNNSLKKYQSEVLLPTYWINKNESHLATSYRSLCHKNLFNEDERNSFSKSKYLASIETLEEISLNSEKSSHNKSIDFLNVTTPSSVKTSKRYNKSRFSLNENIFFQMNCGDQPKIEDNFNKKDRRYNSLNLVHDIYSYNKEVIFFNKTKRNYLDLPNKEVVISIPENMSINNIESSNKKINKSGKSTRIPKSNFRYNPSIRNSNFLKNMRIYKNSIYYRGALLNTHRYRLRASSCPNIFRNSMTTIAKEQQDAWFTNFKEIIRSAFDFSLFLDLKFAIFNFSTLLLFIWFIIPYFYIPEHMKKYNYDDTESAKLISIIGISNTFGMVILGFIGDSAWLNVNICYALCMIVCGISVGLMPIFVENYLALGVLCTIFGLSFASSFSFTPTILVSLVNLDDFTCAYGLVLLVQGIGIIVGPPLAAFIYDFTLRWDDSFYGAGFFITLSGILAYLIEILEKRDQKILGTSCESK